MVNMQVNRWFKKCAPMRGSHKPYKTGFLDFQEKHLPELIVKYPDKARNEKNYFRTKVQNNFGILLRMQSLSES